WARSCSLCYLSCSTGRRCRWPRRPRSPWVQYPAASACERPLTRQIGQGGVISLSIRRLASPCSQADNGGQNRWWPPGGSYAVVQEAAMGLTNLTGESAEYVSAREELR